MEGKSKNNVKRGKRSQQEYFRFIENEELEVLDPSGFHEMLKEFFDGFVYESDLQENQI